MATVAAVIVRAAVAVGMARHASLTEPSKRLTKSTVQIATRLVGVRIAIRLALVSYLPLFCAVLKLSKISTPALARECAHLALLALVSAIVTKDIGRTIAPKKCLVVHLG